MSLDTWKAEFYPCSAHAMETASPVDVVQHSLNKWRGMRIENLTRHNCEANEIRDIACKETDSWLGISGGSCSLCQAYMGKNPDENTPTCSMCPLYIVREGNACDKPSLTEGISPWSRWRLQSDPEPMIMWLEKTLAYVQEKEQA